MNRILWLENYCCDVYHDPRDRSRFHVIWRGNLLTIGYMIFYFIVCYLIEGKIGMFIQTILIFLFTSAFILLRYRVSLDIIGNYISAIGFTGVLSLCYFSGGFASPVLPWISLVPIVSLLYSNQKWATGWLLITLFTILIYKLFLADIIQRPVAYNIKYHEFFYLMSLIGLISTYYLLNLIYKKSLNEANEELATKNKEIEVKNEILENQSLKIATQLKQIAIEKSKSDELLKNILPEDIAENLKANGKTEAKLYENVSILFTDFVGFTRYCETISPQTLIKTLHHYFQAFDIISEKYDLEKIKTIGDSYMAVSGLPNPNADHAINAVKAAIEMRHFVEHYNANVGSASGFNKNASPAFQVRIGIHSGTVIAGIIGNKKFAFDIWGDAVNIAARIEQIGTPQKISISDSTYELVKNHFKCEYQGKITAKNKGDLDLYIIH